MKEDQHHGASTDQRDAGPYRPSSWLDRALIALFLLALVLPAVFLRPDPEAAAAEKRSLAPAPTLPRSLDGVLKFPRAFDAWFVDHFGFRQALIKAHSRFSFFVLRTSPSPKVVLGRDGFIFLKGTPEADGDPIADFRGTVPLTPFELERWRWQLEDQHAWLRDQGIAFLFAIIPGKEQMNAPFMPRGYEKVGPGSYDQFIAHIAPRATYPFVDLRPAILAAGEQAMIYRKTDTHWNDTGAWAGVFALTERLRAMFPAIPKIAPADLAFRVTGYHDGDMGNMIGLPGETYEPLVEIRRGSSTVTTTPLSGSPLGDIITINHDETLPRAVIFHDSFGHYLKPLLGEYFRWLRFRWSNAGIDRSIVVKSQPEVVIHMMAERRIRMGQRYEMPLQQHGNRDRFERAPASGMQWTATNGFDGITTPEGVTRSPEADGLRIERSSRGAGFVLPPIEAAATHLPVIRITCTMEKNDELTLSWTNQTRRVEGEVKGPVPAGRSTVYLPLLDPEATGPIHVDLVRGSGQILIHAIDVRLIPR
jgi:hypothetical protein